MPVAVAFDTATRINESRPTALRTNAKVPHTAHLPECPVCNDVIIAAEASALIDENKVSYLWACENCGYGFITSHDVKQFICQ